MKKVNRPEKKRKYIVFHKATGKNYGETYAVSPEKAINNVWWKYIKHRYLFTETDVRPDDLDAVEADK